jgi:hypothetical protein
MEFRPDGSVLVQTALSMSRLSQEELCREAAETTRLVRLALGGDSTAFEQIISETHALPESSGCRACHRQDAETDHVFTQFYPVLRSAPHGAQLAVARGRVT